MDWQNPAFRKELISLWRRQLQATVAGLETASPRLRWGKAMRVRLLRFLLSFYDSGEWQPNEVAFSQGSHPST